MSKRHSSRSFTTITSGAAATPSKPAAMRRVASSRKATEEEMAHRTIVTTASELSDDLVAFVARKSVAAKTENTTAGRRVRLLTSATMARVCSQWADALAKTMVADAIALAPELMACKPPRGVPGSHAMMTALHILAGAPTSQPCRTSARRPRST